MRSFDARFELRLLGLERAVKPVHFRRRQSLRALEQIAILVGLLVRARDPLQQLLPLFRRWPAIGAETELFELAGEQWMQVGHAGDASSLGIDAGSRAATSAMALPPPANGLPPKIPANVADKSVADSHGADQPQSFCQVNC